MPDDAELTSTPGAASSLSAEVIVLQAGLSALKTPQSYSSTSNKEDPLSTEVPHLLIFQCSINPTLEVCPMGCITHATLAAHMSLSTLF